MEIPSIEVKYSPEHATTRLRDEFKPWKSQRFFLTNRQHPSAPDGRQQQ
jgi:hypothetical protein